MMFDQVSQILQRIPEHFQGSILINVLINIVVNYLIVIFSLILISGNIHTAKVTFHLFHK